MHDSRPGMVTPPPGLPGCPQIHDGAGTIFPAQIPLANKIAYPCSSYGLTNFGKFQQKLTFSDTLPFVIRTRNQDIAKKPGHPQESANPVDKWNNSYARQELVSSGLNAIFSGRALRGKALKAQAALF